MWAWIGNVLGTIAMVTGALIGLLISTFVIGRLLVAALKWWGIL